MNDQIHEDNTTIKHVGIVVLSLVGIAIGLIIAVSIIT